MICCFIINSEDHWAEFTSNNFVSQNVILSLISTITFNAHWFLFIMRPDFVSWISTITMNSYACLVMYEGNGISFHRSEDLFSQNHWNYYLVFMDNVSIMKKENFQLNRSLKVLSKANARSIDWSMLMWNVHAINCNILLNLHGFRKYRIVFSF